MRKCSANDSVGVRGNSGFQSGSGGVCESGPGKQHLLVVVAHKLGIDSAKKCPSIRITAISNFSFSKRGGTLAFWLMSRRSLECWTRALFYLKSSKFGGFDFRFPKSGFLWTNAFFVLLTNSKHQLKTTVFFLLPEIIGFYG
jgi:hypothetical protein